MYNFKHHYVFTFFAPFLLSFPTIYGKTIFDVIKFSSYERPNLVCKIPPDDTQNWVSSNFDFCHAIQSPKWFWYLCPNVRDRNTYRLHNVRLFQKLISTFLPNRRLWSIFNITWTLTLLDLGILGAVQD